VALAAIAGVSVTREASAAADAIPYDRLAAHIVSALQVERGERVLLRHDPKTLGPLEPVLRTFAPAVTPLCASGVAIAIALAQLWPGRLGMFAG